MINLMNNNSTMILKFCFKNYLTQKRGREISLFKKDHYFLTEITLCLDPKKVLVCNHKKEVLVKLYKY